MDRDVQTVEVEGHHVRLTNLAKVLYPETGTTKADVVAYYLAVAQVLLPYTRDRALTRKRWVDGVGTGSRPGAVFFQKQAERSAPSWIPRRTVHHHERSVRYLLADSTATLVWLAQTDTLELHVPQWRLGPRGGRRRPDRLVLDLDPGEEAGLAQCAAVAVAARALLMERGLEVRPVTSGSKGIHLYAPLDGRLSSDQAAALAREVARELEAAHPELVVSSMRKDRRRGRVLVDWSQNNAAKTTVAPYSLRGRTRPTVAAPRRWSEITAGHLDQLDLDEVVARVRSDGDLLDGLDPYARGGPVAVATAGDVDADADAGQGSSEQPGGQGRRPGSSVRPGPAPMLAVAGRPEQVADAAAWAYEPKWDGIRARADVADGRVRLTGRNGTDLSTSYPELEALAGLVDGEVTLDGEIVAVDDAGRPDFGRLQHRMGVTARAEAARLAREIPVHFLAFDLLARDGRPTLTLTTDERRTLLCQHVHDDPAGRVWLSPRLEGDLADALAVSRELGLEGVMAKRRDAPYLAGRRSRAWVKLKHQRTQEVVVGGWRPGQGGRADGVGSLLVGIPEDGRLRYAGRVGTGFDDRTLARLATTLAGRQRDESPFSDVPTADRRDARWVAPELVAEVAFTGWTGAGRLRQPSWRGWRTDRSPDEVVVEEAGPR